MISKIFSSLVNSNSAGISYLGAGFARVNVGFFGCSAPVAVPGRDSAAQIPFTIENCQFTPLQIPSQRLLKRREKAFSAHNRCGAAQSHPESISLMRLRGETATILHLVSDNFGKAPPGKRDSTKVEPIHALQSRCQTLRMTTAAIKWKGCITKMERVLWAGRN